MHDTRQFLLSHGLSPEFADRQMELLRLRDEYFDKLSRWHAGEGEEPAPYEQLYTKMPRTAEGAFEMALQCGYYVEGSLGSGADPDNEAERPWFPASVVEQTTEGDWFVVLRSSGGNRLANVTILLGEVWTADGRRITTPRIGMELAKGPLS